MSMESDRKITSLSNLCDYLKVCDNDINNAFISGVPECCKEEPCMLGIDEAGRGPVLGPMVYGIAFCPLESVQVLKDLNCADSKQLTEANRDEIFNNLSGKDNDVGWAIDVISPSFISSNMMKRTKYSLNEVSMDSAIQLVHKAIEAGVNIAEIYVDTVGPPEKYQAKLCKIFPDFNITVAKKADSLYPIVSAASICAKVARDHCLKFWKFREGLEATHKDFGSGYPGDPVTKSFLQDNVDPVFGFPRLVRFSWSTSSNILEKKALEMEFDEDDVEQAKLDKKATKLTAFFGKAKSSKKRRHEYFRHRFLDNVNEL